MRKIYFAGLVLLLFIANSTYAQPVLTQQNMISAGSVSVIMENGAYFDPGSSGANQTWDLTAIQDTTPVTQIYETPQATPYASTYPAANFAFDYGSGADYEYFVQSSGALQLNGIHAGGIDFVYIDNEDFLHFPLNYNDTYTDAFAATFTSGSAFLRSGNTTVTADGYGTLKLPNHTYHNAMRVHFHEVYQDSTSLQGVPTIVHYDNDQYIWYVPGYPLIIATTYIFTSDQGADREISFYAQNPTDAIDEISAGDDFELYPIPASSHVTVKPGTGNNLNRLEVLDVSGRQILNMEARKINQAAIDLDISAYSRGIYFAQLTYANGSTAIKKFVVQ